MISRDFLYSIHRDKKSIYLFCENKSIIDCQSIYEELYKLEATTDFTFEELQNYQAYIFLNSTLLTGSTELPNNPFYFGELDKDNIIKQDRPSYYFSPKDESSGLGRLSIFYKNDELCLLNYSIIENSLNIKLECLSKQSLEYKDLISNTIKEQKTTQVDKKQSIAKLHALLENQNLECIHGGKVILQSNKGKSFKDNNIPIMLESDLLNSSISACPNTIAGVSVPCSKVANVKGALSQKKVNNEYAILQELISACITDKGFPLKVSFTPTKFKFDHSFDPKEGLGGESKESGLGYEKPIFYIDYKIDYEQKDFIPIHSMKILDEELSSNDNGIKEYKLEISKAKELDEFLKSQELIKNLLQDYTTKENLYKFMDITLQNHTKFYIFIIPKNIPKVLKKYYKDNETYQNNKDYGVGKFKIVDKVNIYDDKTSKSIEIYLAPYEAKHIKIIFNENLYEKLTQTSIFCIR